MGQVNRLRSAEVLFVVNTCTAVGADITRILKNLLNLRIHHLVLQLTGVQIAMLFGVYAIVFGHGLASSVF
jgi:hypothetical protein